jgi:hypothetical protein
MSTARTLTLEKSVHLSTDALALRVKREHDAERTQIGSDLLESPYGVTQESEADHR